MHKFDVAIERISNNANYRLNVIEEPTPGRRGVVQIIDNATGSVVKSSTFFPSDWDINEIAKATELTLQYGELVVDNPPILRYTHKGVPLELKLNEKTIYPIYNLS